jgi:hypothetical protein
VHRWVCHILVHLLNPFDSPRSTEIGRMASSSSHTVGAPPSTTSPWLGHSSGALEQPIHVFDSSWCYVAPQLDSWSNHTQAQPERKHRR